MQYTNYPFIIFLPDTIFKIRKWYRRYHLSYFYHYSFVRKIIKPIERKGIKVLPESQKKEWINAITNIDGVSTPQFDNADFPETNLLYIKLCGNLYFSDSNFTRNKINMERDIMIIISGMFGAKMVSMVNEANNTEELSLSADANIVPMGNVEATVDMNDNYHRMCKINEIYSMSSKSLLFESKWETCNATLIGHLKGINPNFAQFYILCSKLQLFAFKRYNLKMASYSYILDEEYHHEKSFLVRTILQQYGMALSFDISKVEKKSYTYEVEFYHYEQLRFHHLKHENESNDVFFKLYNDYIMNKNYLIENGYPVDKERNKHDQLFTINIFNYIMTEYSVQKNFKKELDKWIRTEGTNYYKLRDCCKDFTSEVFVQIWLRNEACIDVVDASML